jgi:hypothetical protein
MSLRRATGSSWQKMRVAFWRLSPGATRVIVLMGLQRLVGVVHLLRKLCSTGNAILLLRRRFLEARLLRAMSRRLISFIVADSGFKVPDTTIIGGLISIHPDE